MKSFKIKNIFNDNLSELVLYKRKFKQINLLID